MFPGPNPGLGTESAATRESVGLRVAYTPQPFGQESSGSADSLRNLLRLSRHDPEGGSPVQPGDFGLVRISGVTGAAIAVGQRLIGSGSYFTHAFVYMGGGLVVQAQPGGAVMAHARDVTAGSRLAVGSFPLTDAQRADIVNAARSLVGTPYSFLDYAAIGARRLLHTGALERYVADSGHMICSQLVDECYRRAGIELFPNRVSGDVAPGDLARLIGA